MENIVYSQVDKEKSISSKLLKEHEVTRGENDLYIRSGINSIIEIIVSIILGLVFFFLSENAPIIRNQQRKCEFLPFWTKFLAIFYFSLSFLSLINIVILLLIIYVEGCKRLVGCKKLFNLLSIIYLAILHLFFTIIITIFYSKEEDCSSSLKVFTLIWIIIMFSIWGVTILCCSFNWIYSLISLFKSS
jgi:hypothetical protein